MTGWIRWTAPAAAVVAVSGPAYAVQYLSVGEAQKLAFPSATLSEVQPGRVWKASSGGLFVLDHVIGKHLYIDYAVSLDRAGRVHRVDILQYRESYGGEIRSPSWLAQFVGKSTTSPLKVGSDIRNISGATLSSQHVTEGIKRILAAYGHSQ
jgi:FMN-binding domain